MRIYTDSEPALESIASSKQVERKELRNTMFYLKEHLRNGNIESYSWLGTKEMLADVLTKEMKMPEILREFMQKGLFRFGKNEVNRVHSVNGEVRMENIRNRPGKKDDVIEETAET